MPKLSSQWDFGELFPESALRQTFTVSQLTASVKRVLQEKIGRVWVTGEITNLRAQSSGHLYFGIKDANAQLSCVLFRGEARSFDRNLLRDGLKVALQGEITVYEARGQYQLLVTALELAGVGALQAAFERLKQKLQTEGLFAQERKRALPRFPQRIGLVTSSTGAAMRDVLHVIQRRHAGLEIILASCRVQGQGAGEEVACAIRLLNEWSSQKTPGNSGAVDLILVTRGGGSLEDLWAFNEEAVARAIFESSIPVISAVGHEIDFTISDFVADLRAATPSAAAEILTEGYFSVREYVRDAGASLRQIARRRVAFLREEALYLKQRFSRQHPRRWLQEHWQRLDDLNGSLIRCARYDFKGLQSRFHAAAQKLVRVKPSLVISRRQETIRERLQRCQKLARTRFGELQQRLAHSQARLQLLSPKNVLERGYSITLDVESGRVIRSAEEVRADQLLKTHLRQGEILSRVDALAKGEN